MLQDDWALAFLPIGFLLLLAGLVVVYLVIRFLVVVTGWQYVLGAEDTRLREHMEKTGRLKWPPCKARDVGKAEYLRKKSSRLSHTLGNTMVSMVRLRHGHRRVHRRPGIKPLEYGCRQLRQPGWSDRRAGLGVLCF